MPTLRADDSRYLLHAEPWERAAVRRIPAARWLPDQRVYQLPLRDGVVFALDHVFGREGWRWEGEYVELNVVAARGLEMEAPRARATVALEGSQLAVRCDIGDRELVKRVPGYRWSPANKTWYVPALPVALEMLREAFGDLLDVDPEVSRTLDLRAAEEDRAIESERAAYARRQEEERRAEEARVEETRLQEEQQRDLAAAARAMAAVESAAVEVVQLRANGHEGELGLAPGEAVIERLERIDATLQRMEALFGRVMETLLERTSIAPAAAAPETPATAPEEEPEPSADWRSILRQSQEDAAAALDEASRAIQVSMGQAPPELRAVAGIAAFRAGKTQRAYEHLSQALGRRAELEDAALTRTARDTYAKLVLHFLNEAGGPAQPIDSIDTLRQLLLQELRTATGFAAEAIGSGQTRTTLDRLVKDAALDAISDDLADFCRVAHLVGVVRGGGAMAAGSIADLLREDDLHPEAKALTTILYANELLGVDSADEWIGSWPQKLERDESFEAPALVALAQKTLGLVDRELAGPAALAVLAATGSSDEVSFGARKELLSFIRPNEPGRGYAEFLTVFRQAATGERVQWSQYPGYMRIVGEKHLETSWPHLHEVFMAGSGADTAVRAIADSGAYLKALASHGITEPERQLLDLLGLVAAGSKPDNALNELGRMVEDAEIPGVELLSREQRRTIFRMALDESIRVGHDQDAREAFQRLVRALQDDPSYEPLRALCSEAMDRHKKLRVPALVVLIETLLEDGAEFREAMESLSSMLKVGGEDDREDAESQLLGLQFAYPQFAEAVRSAISEGPDEPDEEAPPSFPGRSIVVVGGRQSMRKRAVPVLEHWGVKVDWLDPLSAKNGSQAISLAKGACDLVVVNTACIGHAASGRAIEAAKSAEKEPVLQGSNGVGSMLLAVKRELARLGDQPPKKVGKLAEKKKIIRK